MLRRAYNSILGYASHTHAVWYLNLIAFVESSFFPLPPDPLYIAMLMSRRKESWKLAFMCTLSSVVGGYLGYAIGAVLYETLGEWIIDLYGAQEAFANVQEQFIKWGFWIVALKGLTPIPYKIVTIASGVAGLDLYTFTIASLLARGFRFFSLAALFWFFGPSIKDYIDRNLGFMTTAALFALIGGFILVKYVF